MIIVGPRSRDSANRLAERLGAFVCGSELSEDTLLDAYILKTREFVVNYGGRYSRANLNRNIVTNKMRAAELITAAGISTPKLFHVTDAILDGDFPLMGRAITHSNGSDIIMVRNRMELDTIGCDCDFYMKFIEKDKEYRVHVMKNPRTVETKIIVKENRDPDADNTICSDDSWLHLDYDTFRYPRYAAKLRDLSIAAITTLGYDFGTVDIIRKGETFYVLEVNSGSWLNTRMIEKYARYILQCKELSMGYEGR